MPILPMLLQKTDRTHTTLANSQSIRVGKRECLIWQKGVSNLSFFFSITTMAWHSCRCVSPSRRRVHSTFLAPKQKKIFHKRKSNKSCLAKCWRILYTENNKRPNCHRRIPQIFVVCHCVIAPWTSISICNKKKGYTYKFSLFSRYSRTHTHTYISCHIGFLSNTQFIIV